jgi:hypothetical protein
VADHMLANSIAWGDWSLTGSFTTIDLVAATTNAPNGACASWPCSGAGRSRWPRSRPVSQRKIDVAA